MNLTTRAPQIVVCLLLAVGCSSGGTSNTGAGGSGGSSAGGSGGSTSGTGGTGGSTSGTGGSTTGTGGSTGGAGGGTDAGAGGAGGTTGAGGAPSDGGAGGSGGVAATPCPATLPSGGACAPADRSCSYGDAPRVQCRSRAICSVDHWVTTPAMPCTLAPNCPATAAAATGTCTGDQVGKFCRYTTTNGAGTECACVGNLSGNWLCQSPTAPATPCPAQIPNAGTDCTGTSTCSYPCTGLPLSNVGVNATCVDGKWNWEQLNCGSPAI